MSWVSGLYQIGLRGVGSARQEEFDAARSLGSVMVRAEEVHRQGIDTVLNELRARGEKVRRNGLES